MGAETTRSDHLSGPASSAVPSKAAIAPAGDGWLQFFVLAQIGCQLALSFGGAEQQVRIGIRAIAIGLGLAFIALVPRGGRPLAMMPWLTATAIVLTLNLFHPETEGLVSGLAQLLVYASVLSPLLWVPRLQVNTRTLERMFALFWAFHFASASLGILQVLAPGSFQTAMSSTVTAAGDNALQSLMITLDDGTRVFRPMGLTDAPGGASVSGMYAVIFGAAFLRRGQQLWRRALFTASILAGVACIALSQVRAVAVVVAIALATLVLLLVKAREFRQLLTIGLTVGVAVVAGSMLALDVAREQVSTRFEAFLEDNPQELYSTNRGVYLERTVTDYIPEYPLGAGLGRWGMMNYYFASKTSKEAPLYAEIQLTGWIFDGGIPLLVAYGGLILATFLGIYRVVGDRRRGALGTLAAFVLAYDVGLVALIFSYPLFVGQLGLEFWLFNSALLTAASERRAGRPVELVNPVLTNA